MKDLGLCTDCVSCGVCSMTVGSRAPVLYCDDHRERAGRRPAGERRNGNGTGRRAKAGAGRIPGRRAGRK